MKCRLLRFRISSRLDDGRSLPPSLERHLAHCPECAAWHRAQLSLIHRLRHSGFPATSAAMAEPPSALQAKVMRAIRQAQPAARPRPAGFLFFGNWLPAAGMATALLTAGGLMLTLDREPQGGGRTEISQQTPEVPPGHSIPPPSAAVTAQVSKSAGTVQEDHHDGRDHWLQTAAVSLDTPLRRELALLNEDARSAVRALRASFLPGNL